MKAITLALLIALICVPVFARRNFRGRDHGDDERPDRYDGGDYPEEDYPEDGHDGRDGEDPEEEDDRHHHRHNKKRHHHKNRDEGADEPEENNEEDIPSEEDKPSTPATPLVNGPAPITSSSSSSTTAGTVTHSKSSSGTIIYGTAPVQRVPESTVPAPAVVAETPKEEAPEEEEPEDETPIVDTPDTNEETSSSSNLDSFSQECLNIHNDERASLGIQSMTWSEDLAAAAKSWAEELADQETLKHSDNRVHVGENVGRRSHKDSVNSVPLLIGAWLDEKKDFKNGEYPDIATTGNVHDVGHYSQMIWSTSITLGCAMANGGGRDYMVCQYGPSGNRHGKEVY